MNVILLYAAVDGRDRADRPGSPMNNENRSDRRTGTGGRAWRRNEPPRYTDMTREGGKRQP